MTKISVVEHSLTRTLIVIKDVEGVVYQIQLSPLDLSKEMNTVLEVFSSDEKFEVETNLRNIVGVPSPFQINS